MARAKQTNPTPLRKKAASQIKRSKSAPALGDGPVQYEPSPEELAAIDRYAKARKARPPRITVPLSDGRRTISFDHPQPGVGWVLAMELLGITDDAFFDGIVRQLVNAGSQGPKPDDEGMNFMLSVIRGIEPKDQLEVMLATQMAAVHMAMMTMSRRLAHVETLPQQDSAERAFNKLARTYTTQMEALKRYRTGGQQKVTVEHVTVNEGGQAIVGNVETGDRPKTTEQPTPPGLANQSNTALKMSVIPEREKSAAKRK